VLISLFVVITEGLVPNAKSDDDTRTPEELINLFEEKGLEVAAALALLRAPIIAD
jgi:hypothetical protein